MEREENFNECIKALEIAGKNQKICMIIWFVAAGSMFGLAIFGAVIGNWGSALMDIVLVITHLYIAFLHRSRIKDIGMMKESVEFIDLMITSQKEFHDKVEEIFKEAAEAAANEHEQANDVTFEPIK